MSWPRCFGPSGSEQEREARLAREGCSLEVIIRPDDRAPASPPRQKELHRTSALIDTGASAVCINYLIAQDLGLREIGQTTLYGVSHKIEAHRYLGWLEVPDLEFKRLTEFVAPKVAVVLHEALLGRSFLREFIVSFDGPSGQVFFNKKTPQFWLPADEG